MFWPVNCIPELRGQNQVWIPRSDSSIVSHSLSPDMYERPGADFVREKVRAYFEKPEFQAFSSQPSIQKPERVEQAFRPAVSAGKCRL